MNYPFYGAASITASKRSELINIDNSNGPAMYDTSKEKINTYSPKWTLKPKIQFTSCFKPNKSPPPLPGTYNVSGDIKHKVTVQNPNYRSQKHPKSTQKQSRASDVNIPSTIPTDIGPSFGYRDQMPLFKSTNYSPGPKYNPSEVFQHKRSVQIKNKSRGFGFGERDAIYKSTDSIPGPGAYFEKQNSLRLNYSSSESTFGRSQRNVTTSGNSLGPGEYSPQIYNNGSFLLSSTSGFKLKGKLPEQQKYINPTGPGSYDLPSTKTSIGPRFNHSRNKSQNNRQSSPFAYDCPRYLEKVDDKKGFSLGKRIESDGINKVNSPGPGAYQIGENLAQNKVCGYMGRKTLKKKKVPLDECFGKYDPNYSASARTGPQYKFPIEQKSFSKVESYVSLGPGQYKIKQKITSQSYSIGTSQRFKQLRKEGSIVNNQKLMMSSTIGYLPSYLKKSNDMSLSMNSKQSR